MQITIITMTSHQTFNINVEPDSLVSDLLKDEKVKLLIDDTKTLAFLYRGQVLNHEAKLADILKADDINSNEVKIHAIVRPKTIQTPTERTESTPTPNISCAIRYYHNGSQIYHTVVSRDETVGTLISKLKRENNIELDVTSFLHASKSRTPDEKLADVIGDTNEPEFAIIFQQKPQNSATSSDTPTAQPALSNSSSPQPAIRSDQLPRFPQDARRDLTQSLPNADTFSPTAAQYAPKAVSSSQIIAPAVETPSGERVAPMAAKPAAQAPAPAPAAKPVGKPAAPASPVVPRSPVISKASNSPKQMSSPKVPPSPKPAAPKAPASPKSIAFTTTFFAPPEVAKFVAKPMPKPAAEPNKPAPSMPKK